MTVTYHLRTLETTGLIRLIQEQPELEYLFRHALVRDAAYESLLFSDRQKMHFAAGEILEQMYHERLTEIAPILGQHFATAEDDEKALHYFTLAGDTAVASHANQEAITHYRQALSIAQRLQVDANTLCQLYLKYGRAHELLSQFEAAMAVYEELALFADEKEDRLCKISALMAQAILYIIFTPLYSPPHGEKLVHEALTLAFELGDKPVEVAIGRAFVQLYRYTGRISQAIQTAEDNLVLARQLNLAEQIAFMLYDLGQCYLLDGRFSQSITAIQEAITQWRTLANPTMLADSLATASIIFTYCGQYGKALPPAHEALQISQKAKNLWGQSYAQQAIGIIPWEQGKPAEAIGIMEQSIKLSIESGLLIPQVTTQADLAAVYGSLGAVKQGLEIAQKAVTVAVEQLPSLRAFQCLAFTYLADLQIQAGDVRAAETSLQKAKQVRLEDGRFYTFFVDITQSRLALAQGNYQQAVTRTESALMVAQQFGTQAYIPLLLLWQAQALKASGQMGPAYEQLKVARTAAIALGSQRLLWQILIELSQLEEEPIVAEQYRRQTRAIVQFIADHTPKTLRQTFLNLPQLRHL